MKTFIKIAFVCGIYFSCTKCVAPRRTVVVERPAPAVVVARPAPVVVVRHPRRRVIVYR